MMKRSLFGGLFAVLLLAALGVFARGMETPEEVAAAYVAALNAKDEAALRALYHPNSNFRLNPLQQQFFDESFTRELERTPGEDSTLELIELERGVLPMFSVVDWSSNPLMRMTVAFTEEDGREVQLVRFLSKGRERWFIAFPMPNAKMLAAYEIQLKEKMGQEIGGDEGTAADGASQTAPDSSVGGTASQTSPVSSAGGAASQVTPVSSVGGANALTSEVAPDSSVGGAARAAPALSGAAADRAAAAAK